MRKSVEVTLQSFDASKTFKHGEASLPRTDMRATTPNDTMTINNKEYRVV